MNKLQLSRFRNVTKYNLEKQKKMDNFSYLNRFAKQGQIVLVGDSITELFDMELFDDFSAMSGLRVYNRGIGGDTSDRLVERVEDNVVAIKPSVVVLLIGINDLYRKYVPIDYVLDNTRTIINKIVTALPNVKIVVQNVYPVNDKISPRLKGLNAKVVMYNIKLQRLCQELGVENVDMTSLLSDEAGQLDCELTYDGLHPRSNGFQKVAKRLTGLLEDMLGK